jgi:hypothetical protein
MNLSNHVKMTKGIAPVSVATNTNGAILDMAGYDGVLMVFEFGVITTGAVTSIKAQQDTASGMGTAADLEGTAQTIADADDGKVFYIDLYQPRERYVRGVILNATQPALAALTYYQYCHNGPLVTQPTGTAGELFAAPAEGTA